MVKLVVRDSLSHKERAHVIGRRVCDSFIRGSCQVLVPVEFLTALNGTL